VAAGLHVVVQRLAEAFAGLEEAVAPLATTFAYVGRMYVIDRPVGLTKVTLAE
jgi:hypothetical protein